LEELFFWKRGGRGRIGRQENKFKGRENRLGRYSQEGKSLVGGVVTWRKGRRREMGMGKRGVVGVVEKPERGQGRGTEGSIDEKMSEKEGGMMGGG